MYRRATFAPDKFLQLVDQADRSILASLTWERYVPTTELIHAYGCRLAFQMNETLQTAGKFKEKSN
jgi:hypothetical protein